MNEDNELLKLEGFVSTLLERFNDLQGENKALNECIQRRDVSIGNLENEIASMKDERGQISTRVSGIIGKIEAWESATASTEMVVGEIKPLNENELEPDTEEEKAESGVQGNLFRVEATSE